MGALLAARSDRRKADTKPNPRGSQVAAHAEPGVALVALLVALLAATVVYVWIWGLARRALPSAG
jgi:uncharacterized protein HemX